MSGLTERGHKRVFSAVVSASPRAVSATRTTKENSRRDYDHRGDEYDRRRGEPGPEGRPQALVERSEHVREQRGRQDVLHERQDDQETHEHRQRQHEQQESLLFVHV